MAYPVYDAARSPILADDLNAFMRQQESQAHVYAAPPLKVWRDARGLTLRVTGSQATVQLGGKLIVWKAGFIFAKTTDAFGNPLYQFQLVTLNQDGTITNPGNPPQYAYEIGNNPSVPLPTYQWIQPGNFFEFDLSPPPDPTAYSSDFGLASASQAVPFGSQLVATDSVQTIPTRLFLTLSNLYGCSNLAGVVIQLDLQQFQCVTVFGEPGFASPCSAVFSSPGGLFNHDVCSLLSLQQTEANGIYTGNAWAWYGGRTLADGSILSAVLMYTPGNFGGFPFVAFTQSGAIGGNFDRLGLQLWLLYTPPGGGPQVVAGPAPCDSYYFPGVGSSYNGMNAGLLNEGTGFGVGYVSRFAATFAIGYNGAGPCTGNVVALVQGDAVPLFVGDVAQLQAPLNNALLTADGGAGCDVASVTIH